MKNIPTNSKTETKTLAMKKMSLALVLFCTVTLLSFNACSPGYGCYYSASEKVPEQVETSTTSMDADRVNFLSEEVNCLP